MNGVLAIDKPSGWLSSDVLNYLKHLIPLAQSVSRPACLPTAQEWKASQEAAAVALSTPLSSDSKKANKRRKMPYTKPAFKIGHGGTLDPLASGVLVVGFGTGTKLLHAFMNGNTCRKVYDVTAKLGQSTDTYDSEGKVLLDMDASHVCQSMLQAAIEQHFTGEILQRPPAFSALRKDGMRLYDLARKASQENTPMPETQPRPVMIYSAQLLSFQDTCFRMRIACGGGTYIRSIVNDLGTHVHCCAHMTALRRVQQGPFVVCEQTQGMETEGSEVVHSVAESDNHEKTTDKENPKKQALDLNSLSEVVDRLSDFLWTKEELSAYGMVFEVDKKKAENEKKTQNQEKKQALEKGCAASVEDVLAAVAEKAPLAAIAQNIPLTTTAEETPLIAAVSSVKDIPHSDNTENKLKRPLSPTSLDLQPCKELKPATE